ncbi:MAG: hypothetical protein RQ735_08390 [Flavobacteriaceae bacterium]|nr:hypothetical protein [Flavobacteriaceae bacterium]
MKNNKLSTLFIVVVAVLSFIFLGRIISTGDEAISAGSSDLQGGLVSPFIYLAYFVMAIIIFLVVVFVLRQLFTHKEALKSALLSSGLFLAVVLIGFFASSGNEVVKNGEQIVSAYGDRWVGAGLIIFYILAAVAIGSMFLFGIKKTLKN